MRFFLFRAMRGLWLTCLIAAGSTSVFAASTYTPEERKLVERLPKMLEAKCLEGVTRGYLADSPEQQAALKGWFDALRAPTGACACISSEIMRTVTPDFLHRPDVGEQMNSATAKAGATCMAEALRTAFPAMCPTMMAPVLAHANTGLDIGAHIGSLCRCVNKRIETMSASELEPYTRALMSSASANSSQGSAGKQKLPSSLVADLHECGLAVENEILDEETSSAQRYVDSAVNRAPSAPTPAMAASSSAP